MTLIDTTSLFVHVLAAVGLIGGGLMQAVAGVRVRTADTGRELAGWAGFTRQAGLLIAGSAVASLLSGGHLAGAVWGGEAGGFANPFITLGTAGLLLLAPIGPMLGGARLRRLAQAAVEIGDGHVPADIVEAANSPALWGPVHSLIGVGVGLVALMIYKPGWLAGAAILLVTFALGWIVGAAVSRRGAVVADPVRGH